MKEVYKNIFIGNQNDYKVSMIGEWAFVHACKDPFHKELVGYKGNLSPMHIDYPFKEVKDRLALNLVDMDLPYNSNYHNHYKKIFEYTINFINRKSTEGKKILIHCNQGESRGPSIGMLYLASKGIFGYNDFNTTEKLFLDLYPQYLPKRNIRENLQQCWEEIIISKK